MIRYGAGPALIFSFMLLGGACALAGLCYAELAWMIPQAVSAYAYSYATLGELVAWIIGWDLILEYAVGNVAVAIIGYTRVGWIVALGAAISMSTVLLVFQYGQPRIFFAMARDGLLPQWAARVDARTRIPYMTTIVTGVVVALAALVGDAAETYDLTNIGTLFAFALVCAGVMVLRLKEPERPRPFKVPLVWVVAPLGIAACVFVMAGLPYQAWERFGAWIVVGLAIYVFYGYRHSRMRSA